MKNTVGMCCCKRHLSVTASAGRLSRMWGSFPCTLLRTTTKESSAGKFIKRPRRSLHIEVPATPPTSGQSLRGYPAIHPDTLSVTGLSAGNAGLSIAVVPGSVRVAKRSSGDAAADWTTAADTANILPQWRREPFREQSWQQSTP